VLPSITPVMDRPQKSFPNRSGPLFTTVWQMSVVMMYFHMSSSGPFRPGYRQDDVKGFILWSLLHWPRCISGESVNLPCSKRTTDQSQTQHLFIAASPECARYSADTYNGTYYSKSASISRVRSSILLPCRTSFQLGSHNTRKIFTCS
jgi:hypothetical protein